MSGLLDGLRLLVVEDEFLIAHDLVRELRAAGAQVIGPAPSVDAALELLDAAGELDGAVIDINLQGETAYPVAEALMERNVPLVFATGYDQSAIPRRYGHVARCEKPVDIPTLARALTG